MLILLFVNEIVNFVHGTQHFNTALLDIWDFVCGANLF